MRMSQHEIKQEHRQTEGDPHMKGAHPRPRSCAMSRNRMMADVATADVVLVNPTHVAVALRTSRARGAPRVVAKGAGAIAARIRERGREAPRADGRGHPAGPGAATPRARSARRSRVELYDAVAQVLAFVMALRTRGSATGVHTVRPRRCPLTPARLDRRAAGRRLLRSGAARPMGPVARTAPAQAPRTVDPQPREVP